MLFTANFSRAGKLFLIILIHLGFAFVGAVTTLLGVILPALATRLSLTDAESGSFFTAQFAGSLAGTFVSERIWTRIGFLPTLSIGLLAMTIGVCGLGWLDFYGVWLCILLVGCGLGLTIPTTNLLIAKTSGEKAASALNILNFAWGCGALLCPFFVAALGDKYDVRSPMAFLSAFLAVFALCFLPFSRFLRNFPAAPETQLSDRENVWQTRFAILTAVLFFLYVGVESGISGWITTYWLRLSEENNQLWTPATAVFWTTFLLGRLLAPLFLRRISKGAFLSACLTTAAVGMLWLLAVSDIFLIIVGVACVGFGLAPVFPTALAQFTTIFGEAGTQQAKWLFVSSTVGGAFLTWFIGVVSTAFGNLSNGLMTVLVACLIMIIVQIASNIGLRNEHSSMLGN